MSLTILLTYKGYDCIIHILIKHKANHNKAIGINTGAHMSQNEYNNLIAAMAQAAEESTEEYNKKLSQTEFERLGFPHLQGALTEREKDAAEGVRLSFFRRVEDIITSEILTIMLKDPDFLEASFWLNHRFIDDEDILALIEFGFTKEYQRRQDLYSDLMEITGYSEAQIRYAEGLRRGLLDRLPDEDVSELLIEQLNSNDNGSQAQFWIDGRRFGLKRQLQRAKGLSD